MHLAVGLCPCISAVAIDLHSQETAVWVLPRRDEKDAPMSFSRATEPMGGRPHVAGKCDIHLQGS